MRKVILCVAVSLDGFIEGPNGEYDWCFNDQDYGLTEFFGRIDAIFMGRKSYEMSSNMEAANPWKGTMTYVFSNSMKEITSKDTKLITGDIVTQVRAIKNLPGKDIWLFGGASLTTTFVNEQLIDEYWLAVHPIILGAGKPLFQNIDGRKRLKLRDQKTYSTGLINLFYEPDNLNI
jgi:dihydrofolate reductase